MTDFSTSLTGRASRQKVRSNSKGKPRTATHRKKSHSESTQVGIKSAFVNVLSLGTQNMCFLFAIEIHHQIVPFAFVNLRVIPSPCFGRRYFFFSHSQQSSQK